MTGVEHLTDRQQARLDKHLPVGAPLGEGRLAWQAYQRLRSGDNSFAELVELVEACCTKVNGRVHRESAKIRSRHRPQLRWRQVRPRPRRVRATLTRADSAVQHGSPRLAGPQAFKN